MGFFSYPAEKTVDGYVQSAKANIRLFEESKFDYLLVMAISELEAAKKLHDEIKDIQLSNLPNREV